MSVPSNAHNIRLVLIQSEERLAATSELNLAPSLVTGCGEVRGRGYWAATQVKGLSPEIFIVAVADIVHLTEGSTLIADSLNLQSWNIAGRSGTWRGDEVPTGSETVARYQMDIMGTREGQSVLLTGVCAIKPINGKIVQTTLWESDQLIVLTKQGNACGGKGLAVEPLGQGHIHRTKRRVMDGNKTGLITDLENDREVLLKSRIRENLKPGSVRVLIAASGRRWLRALLDNLQNPSLKRVIKHLLPPQGLNRIKNTEKDNLNISKKLVAIQKEKKNAKLRLII